MTETLRDQMRLIGPSGRVHAAFLRLAGTSAGDIMTYCGRFPDTHEGRRKRGWWSEKVEGPVNCKPCLKSITGKHTNKPAWYGNA